MKESTINKIEVLTGWFIEPYMEHTRVRIIYRKNDKEQHAVFMNYNKDGKDYKLIEDSHTARNGLQEKESQTIAALLNNNEIRLYANN